MNKDEFKFLNISNVNRDDATTPAARNTIRGAQGIVLGRTRLRMIYFLGTTAYCECSSNIKGIS